jgi:hypothetical protein
MRGQGDSAFLACFTASACVLMSVGEQACKLRGAAAAAAGGVTDISRLLFMRLAWRLLLLLLLAWLAVQVRCCRPALQMCMLSTCLLAVL